ncbi:uncharacterized protein LODBEIA_P25330 [Lodderomyces beijingensis]|uniref:Amino acid transporter transmembrane domain-containing protein n=1 Tax=Lodderomyces beijingensis TaxID=1775926 RepID=A0ABP0ZJI4_9ASCO
MTAPSSPLNSTASAQSDHNRRRRSSFMDYGGANSLHKFASSYTRAQQHSGSSLMERHDYNDDDDDDNDDADGEGEGDIGGDYYRAGESGRPGIHPRLSSPLPPSASYASVADESQDGEENEIDARIAVQNHEGDLEVGVLNGETAPLIIPTTSKSGRRSSSVASLNRHGGTSTSAQTIFNSINTLVGIGMLSLPFGFRLSGWICGVVLLVGSALSTNLTAKYLGRILHLHRHQSHQMTTYADISYAFGGRVFALVVTGFFVLDLLGASLSLIILFADCFYFVWPHVNYLKLIIVVMVFVTSFLPLNILSMFSLGGILATIGIISVIIGCGFINVVDDSNTTDSASFVIDSLLHFAPTEMFPRNFNSLLFSLGIFMAPWGGHPVFPELYRDMKHPQKFSKSSNISYLITFVLDFTIGVTGYLMYGTLVDDSIIKNIMRNPSYPAWVNKVLCLLMGILPISKLPLVTRPIITSYERILGISPPPKAPHYSPSSNAQIEQDNALRNNDNCNDNDDDEEENFKLHRDMASSHSPSTLKTLRVLARFTFCCILLLLSLFFTSFGNLISFLGSAICYTVCLTLPMMFYLKLNRSRISVSTSWFLKIGVAISIVLAVLGTYASITIKV